MNRPFAESCEQNRRPILSVIGPRLAGRASLLEIGSGTGQHAVYFAPELPHLVWQTSDRAENHPGILAWLEAMPAGNLPPPLQLDAVRDPWPDQGYEAAFSANTAHIMSQAEVQAMFEGLGRVLQPGSPFLLYGPFNIDGRYTAPSNQRFDAWLQQQDPAMGVRDLAWLQSLAEPVGLRFQEMVDMPADNKILCWIKGEGRSSI